MRDRRLVAVRIIPSAVFRYQIAVSYWKETSTLLHPYVLLLIFFLGRVCTDHPLKLLA